MIQPPVDAAFYTPDPGRPPASDVYLVRLGPGALQADRPGRGGVHASGRRLIVIGEGPERARLEAMAGPTRPVPGLAARRRDPRPLPALPGPALPRRGGFRDRPDRGPGLRHPGDRAGRAAARPRPSMTPSAGPTPSPPPTACSGPSTPGKRMAARTTRPWPAAAPRPWRSRCSASGCSASSPKSRRPDSTPPLFPRPTFRFDGSRKPLPRSGALTRLQGRDAMACRITRRGDPPA